MYKLQAILLLLVTMSLKAQDNPTERAQPIVLEGKELYKSEMASWYGTDVFMELYKDKANIGGYFSYTEKNKSTCIFFSKSENPQVIGAIEFDSTYNVKTANTDLKGREFTQTEMNLYLIRQNALVTINADTMFKTYNNTSLNVIPLLLYEKAAKWNQHNVVSKEYLNIWNCHTNYLVVCQLPP